MEHEWKIGDWCELFGKRHLVFKQIGRDVWAIPWEGGHGVILFPANDKEVKHLPDCDSWDWQPPKPIEPPEGYRLLRLGEIVLATDQFHDGRYGWGVLHESSIAIGKPWDAREFMPMARKIDRYRPFANAAEFAPHRDKWVIPKCEKSYPGYHGQIDCYLDAGIYSVMGNYAKIETWKHAFDVLQFEDGTPFGVKLDDDAKPSGSGSK